ncbi:CAZyme family AA7 [Trichoderma aggressivum f. europaeum]|uniref:CAZyme family AA7 n=1 Tax=Trichoderma aggressivum f. europaeum TaxID=173218 RepID=A0AAE1IG18_9HYPO|nr:CAZyme family AA7 [Trichoderma aggressivum f. europaeum]
MARFRLLSLLAFLCVLENAVALPQGYSDEPKPNLKPLLTDQIRKWSLNTTVSFPSSPAFNASTERWTIADPPTYVAAIRPGTEEDISKVINLARTKRFPFLTRGGGHGYAASLGDFQLGLSLDLSQWKNLKIDKKARTLTVGPGITFAEIFDPLFNAGFYIQTGSCSCPSMIGVTLGGGIGRLMGKYGLLMDALQSVRMVGADGKVMTVSANSHPDLWWGIRGAGANFGVITSATYKVYPLVNNENVFVADFYVPVERSREYFDMVEVNFSNMPANLAQVQLVGNWVYFGTEKEARKVLGPVFNLNATSSTRIVQWNKLVSSGGFDEFICQPNQPRSLFSLNQKIYSADGYRAGFEKIEKYFYDHPGGRDTTLVIENFPNQAVAAVPDDSTAFPWRDFKGFIQVNFAWKAGDEATARASNKLGEELRNQFAATSGYSEKTVFVNYARGDETIESIYGKRKLPRLAKLKKKYDPSNLFAYNHPLPMHYP